MEIINRVKNSGLLTLDLEEFLPAEDDLVAIDIKDQLWQGVALREKEFRNYIETNDWSQFEGKIVHIYCSEDAIVPVWAYMLMVTALFKYTQNIIYGDRTTALEFLVLDKIQRLNTKDYEDARVVIKGCAKIPNIEKAFTALTLKLLGVARSIMYGEPCSTVPIYKAPKK
jgi:hypothetical protein